MQLTERILHQNKRCRYNAEENRIGQHSKNSLRKFSFCSYKEYRILTDKRKDKSEEELMRPIRLKTFGVNQKCSLKHDPRTPNDIGDFFAVFASGGINTCGSVRNVNKNKLYNRSGRTRLFLLSFILIIPKGFFDFRVLTSRNWNTHIVI